MRLIEAENEVNTNSKAIQIQLNEFEAKLAELKILYEQHFCCLLPLAPEQEHREVKVIVRNLLRTPFKNSQTNFRLKNLVLRFQTLSTHWERILKQKEEGTYSGDIFRANIRNKYTQEERKNLLPEGNEDKVYKELFNSYRKAMDCSGIKTQNLQFATFKNELKKKASLLKANNGANEVYFRVEVAGGKVAIKARVE
jgi:hypothetical protein